MNTLELSEKYVLGTYGRFPVAFERGKGCWIWDENGKKYLDFGAGIAVCSVGHSPECMKSALRQQSEQLIHCSNLYHIPGQAKLAEFIVEKAVQLPGKVFFGNSGAEVNDGAVKLARKYFYDQHGDARQHEVVTCKNSFHGRTLGGIAATGQEKVKIGFDPLLPGFAHVPFNDCEALRMAVSEKTAAILFEPIQGEGGINTASTEFFETAADLRERFGTLIMLDEVQCGFGRTGQWCAWRNMAPELEPDVITWAKGMAGGFPMGAFWVADRHASALGPGTHGSTFGGTPLGSSVALAVLQEIENHLANIPILEAQVRNRFENWNSGLCTELRGAGLMLGFVLDPDRFPDEAEGNPAVYTVKKLMQAGLLTVPSGSQVVRWLPPLNVTASETDRAFDLMEQVFAAIETKGSS